MAKALRIVAAVLRVAAGAAAAAAAIIMATSHETTSFFGLEMEAKYQYTPSFVFFVAANSVACAYSLLAFFVAPASPASRFILMTDVMLSMVLTGAIAATGAISEIAKNGNTHAGWLPICGQVYAYCHRVMGALISGFVALLLYFLILVYSIYIATNPLFPCHE